jgi:hypothetical protein
MLSPMHPLLGQTTNKFIEQPIKHKQVYERETKNNDLIQIFKSLQFQFSQSYGHSR